MRGTEDRARELARMAVDAIRERKAEGDAYVSLGESLELAVGGGVLEKQLVEENSGIGIRTIVDGRVGFTYTTELARESIAAAVAAAIEISRFVPPDEDAVLLPPPDAYPPVVASDPAFSAASLQEKIDIAFQIESTARAFDPRVAKLQESAYQDMETAIAIANTRGVDAAYHFTRAYAWCECAAVGGGESQVGWSNGWALSARGINASEIGREAAERAVEKLAAASWTTAAVDVLLERRVAAALIGAAAHALRADEVLRGKSLFAGKLGESVASPAVTLIDDGSLAGGSATTACDDEGAPARRTVLVNAGALEHFLHNARTAHRMNARPTGNATRSGYTSPPKIGPTNLFLEPGAHPPSVLMKEMSEGILITETMGLHTIDPVTGEFSLGANGMRIANGEVAEPINGVGIAGNLAELLRKIVAVGSDFRSFAGGGGSSSLWIEALMVSGR